MASVARATYTAFPFSAIVGQDEAKLALVLAAINPRVGGVLLSGPKGTGKTTLVRAAGELLPALDRATCPYGCDPNGSNLCAACAATLDAGKPLAHKKVRGEIVELPVNAQLDDVVGAIDLKAALERATIDFRPGLLARANRNVLYVDEVNLLSDLVVDALLDAAAQGVVHVKRGQHAIDYPSRFTLIGTMNPEEGELRPQITDRIGLRVFVRSAPSFEERLEIYRRNAAFARDARSFGATFEAATKKLRARLAQALKRVETVRVDAAAEAAAIEATARLGIDSHRTEFVALEAATALAAWEGRDVATPTDVARVFPLAARLRRSRLRVEAQSDHLAEDAAIEAALEATLGEGANDLPEEPVEPAPRIVVAPELTQKTQLTERPQREREGQPVGAQPLGANGRLDIGATLLDRAASSRAGIAPEPKEPVDAATPPRLSILVVDASLSTQKSSELVRAATRELLRPVYTERERAALISCWGPRATIAVDENTGRNIDLVAARLDELEPGAVRALTPLPEALELARTIAERFRRAHAGAEVDVAVFSDGRANVPLGGEAMLAKALDGDGVRELGELASEQCRHIASQFAGRAKLTCVNLDEYEAHPLMREIATLARGRYFPLSSVVAKIL
ncbi:MAG: ATP-binding protein [Candidatus Eremiobacteraeota bacterium]|nr:ATP-binding protein [Candidatus Eremiobacteraeota bacterium]